MCPIVASSWSCRLMGIGPHVSRLLPRPSLTRITPIAGRYSMTTQMRQVLATEAVPSPPPPARARAPPVLSPLPHPVDSWRTREPIAVYWRPPRPSTHGTSQQKSVATPSCGGVHQSSACSSRCNLGTAMHPLWSCGCAARRNG